MKILSIETSCDETGITILEAKGGIKNPSFKVLSNYLNSQVAIHSQYGGVFPALAKREHIINLPILLEQNLEQLKLKNKKKPVDLIAVTYGPGLEPALWTGIVFAKELAEKWKVPIVPVNHMEGHIFSSFVKINKKFTLPKIKFPVLSLLVSGGHTELVLSKKWLQYEILGATLDDAAGEAFDKVARMLELPYPGGPHISKLAEKERASEKKENGEQSFMGVSQADGPRGSAPRARGDSDPEKISSSFSLPRPMLHSKNFDFSFSGLKTAVLYLTQKIGKLDDQTKQKIAMEFEDAVVDTLVYKTIKAKEKFNIKTLIVAGGVACNEHLKRQIQKTLDKKTKLYFPERQMTGDNSIMIGVSAYLQYLKNKRKTPNPKSIKANGNLRLG